MARCAVERVLSEPHRTTNTTRLLSASSLPSGNCVFRDSAIVVAHTEGSRRIMSRGPERAAWRGGFTIPSLRPPARCVNRSKACANPRHRLPLPFAFDARNLPREGSHDRVSIGERRSTVATLVSFDVTRHSSGVAYLASRRRSVSPRWRWAPCGCARPTCRRRCGCSPTKCATGVSRCCRGANCRATARRASPVATPSDRSSIGRCGRTRVSAARLRIRSPIQQSLSRPLFPV